MKPEDFRKTYNEQLKTFLATPAGQQFVSTLSVMRPGYESSAQNHLFAENRGAVRGYELCIRNLVSLSFPYAVQSEPEANYGVANPKAD